MVLFVFSYFYLYCDVIKWLIFEYLIIFRRLLVIIGRMLRVLGFVVFKI